MAVAVVTPAKLEVPVEVRARLETGDEPPFWIVRLPTVFDKVYGLDEYLAEMDRIKRGRKVVRGRWTLGQLPTLELGE